MGLCASMLQWKAKRRQPKQNCGTPKVHFVVRNDGRPSKPQALVSHRHSSSGGRSGSQLQKPGGRAALADSKKPENCRCDVSDVQGRRLRVPKPPRLPCGTTRSVATAPVPVAADGMRSPPVFRAAAADGRAAAGCRTPMTPRRTPIWQRRILMGTRCELPRFSGLILYDEHGRRVESSAPNRLDHLISRGNKKTARRTATTLRDLL
ncbi:hypothetical protein BS78_10G162400 [Paspalum vaginatum]|nr:hypothetical protein BS78_10G162400 [Paspalum vaginatum]